MKVLRAQHSHAVEAAGGMDPPRGKTQRVLLPRRNPGFPPGACFVDGHDNAFEWIEYDMKQNA